MFKKKSTIIEVAKLAKVGTSSVSRYFVNPNLVSIKLKKRITKASNKLSYFPNPIASSLASKRSKIIPVYIPTIRYAIAHFMRGIEKVLHDSGYQTLISTNDGNLINEEKIIDNLLIWNPSGLIIIGKITSKKAIQKIKDFKIPIVETAAVNPIDLAVGINHKIVGEEMAQFIINKKYKNIAFVGTNLNDLSLHTSQIYNGFKKELIKNKLKVKNLINISEKEKDKIVYGGRSVGSEAIKKILKKDNKTEIIVFADDIFALAAHIYCQKMNIKIPKHLSLVTFCTTFSEIKEVSPSFTSIDMDFLKVGEKSGEVILKKIKNKKVNKLNEIQHYFVEGGTTK
ncbi:LacI family transcriptional regulator [Alphaproteobacteria bacterium]|nr:LacI family transcriptional regulator [Alphaproteobacteria bacterium]